MTNSNFMKMVECFSNGQKTLGKGEIARFQNNSKVFSKEFYCRHVKTRACLGKG